MHDTHRDARGPERRRVGINIVYSVHLIHVHGIGVLTPIVELLKAANSLCTRTRAKGHGNMQTQARKARASAHTKSIISTAKGNSGPLL
jgi:hypothetical protein